VALTIIGMIGLRVVDESHPGVLLAPIAVHAVAALWHHFIRRDGVVARMVTDEAG
jgi:cytochrome b561